MSSVVEEGITGENFQEIMETYAPTVHRYLDYNLRYQHQVAPEEVEDAYAQVWFNVWRSRTTFRYDRAGEQALKGWIIQIIFNVVRDTLRRLGARRGHIASSLDTYLENEEGTIYREDALLVDESTWDWEERLATQEECQTLVQQMLGHLSSDQRVVLWQVYALGYKPGELPQPIEETYTLLHNAKKRLRYAYKRLES